MIDGLFGETFCISEDDLKSSAVVEGLWPEMVGIEISSDGWSLCSLAQFETENALSRQSWRKESFAETLLEERSTTFLNRSLVLWMCRIVSCFRLWLVQSSVTFGDDWKNSCICKWNMFDIRQLSSRWWEMRCRWYRETWHRQTFLALLC